ncbi:MAG: hypothetical protein HQM01_11950 [Magnetococcales bacterium]|nr:hypothetical protein [Magnetococcales bacterium]
MFTFTDHHEFVWPVRVLAPENGAQKEIGGFDARFLLLPVDRVAELSCAGDEALLTGIVTGWDGIRAEEGQELPFSPENLKLLGNNPCVRAAIFRGYFEAASGKAREKN